MSQNIEGIRSVLSLPRVYGLFGDVIGALSARTLLVEDYIRPQTGDRILDIGCGPADIISYLPEVEYVGFDASKKYVEAARAKFGDRATFFCDVVSREAIDQQSYFDLVLAIGILHHLNETEAVELCQLAQTVLKPGGRLVTFDGCYVEQQSPCARYFLSKDRGQYVRDRQGYVDIVSQVFSHVVVSIRHDLLRIPYTHIILECTK